MTRRQAGSVLTWLAAALFVVTAAFHHTGYASVRAAAAQAGGDIAVLMPILWLFFSINLVILGLAAAVMAWRPGPGHGSVLVCLGLVPAAAAALQIVSFGFVLPTAILIVDAIVAIAAGVALGTSPSA